MTDADGIGERIEEAYDALEQDELERAFEIGAELCELGHSAGYEISALAHEASEDVPKAIEVLEAGVRQAPEAWSVWQLLGNYRSDQEEYEAAFAAYERAAGCPEVDANSLHYNLATALIRSGRTDAGLELLDDVAWDDIDQELAALMVGLKCTVLSERDRHDLIEALCDELLAQVDTDEEPLFAAQLHAELGRALNAGRGSQHRALRCARKAIQFDKSNMTAQWLLRELTGSLSPDAKFYVLVIHGDWAELSPDDEELSFYAAFRVVADSPEQAFRMACACEPAEVQSSLRLDQVEVVSEAPDVPTGVYDADGYRFYLRGEEESD